MSLSNPVSAKRYSVKKVSKSELKGPEQIRLYVSPSIWQYLQKDVYQETMKNEKSVDLIQDPRERFSTFFVFSSFFKHCPPPLLRMYVRTYQYMKYTV